MVKPINEILDDMTASEIGIVMFTKMKGILELDKKELQDTIIHPKFTVLILIIYKLFHFFCII